jgi:hypothetical protein
VLAVDALGVFPDWLARSRGDRVAIPRTQNGTVYDIPAVATLRADLSRGPRLDNEALHDEVCAVVDQLKAAGWPPERVIVAVKRIGDDAGLRPSRAVLNAKGRMTPDDALIVRMIQWCIERYYSRDD